MLSLQEFIFYAFACHDPLHAPKPCMPTISSWQLCLPLPCRIHLAPLWSQCMAHTLVLCTINTVYNLTTLLARLKT